MPDDKRTTVVGGFPVADRSSNRERAAARLVEVLTPAAALGIECPRCGARAPNECDWGGAIGTMVGCHPQRWEAARAELHQLLLTLGLG